MTTATKPSQARRWALEHPERHLAHKKAFYANNREKECQRVKNWRANNRKRLSEYQKTLRRNNVGHRLATNLRIRVWSALKRGVKSAPTLQLLGCSVDQLKVHLESQFKPGMTWANYGQWHVDHRRPCASFDLSKSEEQRVCFHYTNLQPLWAIENFSKNAR